ncbi:MAG TPA: hypothetical protein VIJ19_04145 [Opitutaceae bacterium]
MQPQTKESARSAVLWVTVAIVSGLLVLPFHPPVRSRASGYAFEATVSSTARGTVQLFYDVGRGFNEADSGSVAVRGDGSPALISVPLPFANYRALRFDPLDRPGTVTVSRALIRGSDGTVVVTLPPAVFEASQQIRRMAMAGDTLTIETDPVGNDPNTLIRLGEPLVLNRAPARDWIDWLRWSTIAFVVLGAGVIACLRIPGESWAAFMGSCSRRPKATLAVAALLALLLNSSPVILFGRSFVSPNNGVLLLYEDTPTLPGYDSTRGENVMGSDVGAVMWWHMPVSRVQHEALFRDHEFPLWNRYDLCGQALLGQGQSMIGDPLHWITAIASGGSAVGWDIKYLVAKWLFAFVIGLLVLELTGGLPVACLIGASSLFIGFFSFRLNHPTIFSLCYSPCMVYSWVRISKAPHALKALPWTAALFLSNWIEINSGTVKEAYILAAWLNATGFAALLANRDGRALKTQKLLMFACTEILFLMVSAPVWVTFLGTLGSSVTSYDAPQVWQLPASRFIGFFEDLFYRQGKPIEVHVDPSANFLVLLGMLWAAVRWRGLWLDRTFAVLCVSFAAAALFVFGGVPASVVTAIPFLRNVFHVDATFSCVLIVLAMPLAGFGLKSGADLLTERRWNRGFGCVLGLFTVLLGAYLMIRAPTGFSRFFIGYSVSIIVAFVVLQVAARALAKGSLSAPAAFLLIAASLGALHWRQAQYLTTAFDDYVFNPQVRADFDARSPSVDLLGEPKAQPSRTVGLGLNLFPGYNARYSIEGIYGIEALRSREYQELALKLGLDRTTAFTTPQLNEESGELRAAYDALNVTYFLKSPNSGADTAKGWSRLADLDLLVFQSDHPWPRAFYVDGMGLYDDVETLVRKIREANGHPFAAMQRSSVNTLPDTLLLSEGFPHATVVPASRYALTNNTTSFDIDAPRPGIAVLTETWLKDDFVATVDGKVVPYLRVNHAFKGVYIGSAGSHRVEFRYWPRHLTLALWVSAFGILASAASYGFARRTYRVGDGAAAWGRRE